MGKTRAWERRAWQTPKTLLALYREDLPGALGRSGKTLSAMRRAVDERGAGVLDADDGAVKVWSDLHLGHANIIRFQDRPFRSLGEMDAALWRAWETEIGPNDTLICVGDFAMGRARVRATWHRVRAAPGRRKILVIGNHDLGERGSLAAHGFHSAKALLVSGGDPPLIWTHAPLPKVPAGHVNIHGHQHARLKPADSPHINVSVEQLDYRPVSLARLRRLAKALVAGERPAGGTTLERIEALTRKTRG